MVYRRGKIETPHYVPEALVDALHGGMSISSQKDKGEAEPNRLKGVGGPFSFQVQIQEKASYSPRDSSKRGIGAPVGEIKSEKKGGASRT